MRRRARTDANQRQIVQALRDRGATVIHLHQLGKGIPDILVGFNGRNYLVELKDGSKPPSKRQLTHDEKQFFSRWQGEVAVVCSPEEAIAVVGLECAG